jgi:hypothetical protein
MQTSFTNGRPSRTRQARIDDLSYFRISLTDSCKVFLTSRQGEVAGFTTFVGMFDEPARKGTLDLQTPNLARAETRQALVLPMTLATCRLAVAIRRASK